jgi:hypothetical protein
MATFQLRQMSVGEIIDGALALFRHHFRIFLGIALICQGVPMALYAYVQFAGGILFHPILGLVSVLLVSVGGLVVAGASLRAISQAYLGSAPTVRDALSYAVGKIGALFIAGLARILVIGLTSLLLIIPAVVALVVRGATLIVVALAAPVLIVPTFVVACGYGVTAQAVVLEELSFPTDALGRSWSLTKGHKGKVFLLGVVVFALVYFLPPLATGILSVVVPALERPLFVVNSVLSVVLYPLVACSFTLLYYDLRVRKEAFDLEHLSQQLGAVPAG